jgi:osmoprotectant transport system substrate-binding protein
MHMLKKFNKILLILMVLAFAFTLTACGGNKDTSSEGTVTVGGKEFTEQDIMVHLVSELIEAKTELTVNRKPFLGGTNIVFTALKSGDLDISVDYTGTGLVSILGEKVVNDADEAYRIVKEKYNEKYNITWLEPLGFNNTYAIVMKEEVANELGIEKISDLKEYASDFSFAATQEFMEREDGYSGMKEVYGFEFKDAKGMDPGLLYTAIDEGQVDVSVAFATDGRIPAFNLKILEDDKNYFPPYDAAILIRNDTLEKYPELEDVLNSLAGLLTDEEMAKLNAQVDIEGKDSKQVAKDWLKEKGLID